MLNLVLGTPAPSPIISPFRGTKARRNKWLERQYLVKMPYSITIAPLFSLSLCARLLSWPAYP